jgi:PadR family transcriptional regulator AphA
MLKYALLGFLTYKSNTGYELKQRMDTSTNHFWHAKQSQIYTTLKKMEASGLVTSSLEHQDGRPDRRVYTITESGQKDLQKWLSESENSLDPVKHTMLLKLFFSAKQDKESILNRLQSRRILHEQQVDHYKSETADVINKIAESVPELKPDAFMWDATRRFGQLYEEMTIQWIDETIAMVEKEF